MLFKDPLRILIGLLISWLVLSDFYFTYLTLSTQSLTFKLDLFSHVLITRFNPLLIPVYASKDFFQIAQTHSLIFLVFLLLLLLVRKYYLKFLICFILQDGQLLVPSRFFLIFPYGLSLTGQLLFICLSLYFFDGSHILLPFSLFSLNLVLNLQVSPGFIIILNFSNFWNSQLLDHSFFFEIDFLRFNYDVT